MSFFFFFLLLLPGEAKVFGAAAVSCIRHEALRDLDKTPTKSEALDKIHKNKSRDIRNGNCLQFPSLPSFRAGAARWTSNANRLFDLEIAVMASP